MKKIFAFLLISFPIFSSETGEQKKRNFRLLKLSIMAKLGPCNERCRIQFLKDWSECSDEKMTALDRMKCRKLLEQLKSECELKCEAGYIEEADKLDKLWKEDSSENASE